MKLVRCKLGSILGDRDISITNVSNATGISRTTLTALKKNKCRGISFRTLDVLCTYLNVSPGDLIDYLSEGRGH